MNWDPTVALIVAAVGAVLLAGIYLAGLPKKRAQVRRRAQEAAERLEPTLGGDPDAADSPEGGNPGGAPKTVGADKSSKPSAGARADSAIEKIVTLHVEMQEGGRIRGTDLVVAAEKAGLTYGAMGIFHRLVDGKASLGPVFSVANMIKPGHFDLSDLEAVQVPGLTFFMTLPGPLPGLDAWDTMLPAAQRMAELLGGQLLDDRRNPMGRQRIALLRDELRAFDRQREIQGLR